MTDGPMAALPLIEVLAGVLEDARGRVLLAERPPGKAFAGRWEFPGGKREPGESPREALVRELREELGIEVLEAEPLLVVSHCYPDAPIRVRIDSWRVSRWHGTPQSLDGQRLQWCARSDLAQIDILEADRPIVTALRLPRVFVVGATGGGDPAGVRWDPSSAVQDAVSVYSSASRLLPATTAAALVGCRIEDATAAHEAALRGADFLLVPAHVDVQTLALLATLGLPWYLDEHAPTFVTARATGALRGDLAT